MTDLLKPSFSLTADGQPFSAERVLSIEITDEAGVESDTLTIVLDDALPQIEKPREGARIAVSIGYEETGLVEYGTYVFEELTREGYPRRAIMTAKAADHAGSLKEIKSRSWSNTTAGSIIKEIAGNNQLKPVIAQRIDGLKIQYLAQTEESDQNLLTRLGRRIGAVIAPKDGHLVAADRHSGKSASGRSMPEVRINPGSVLSYSTSSKPRSRFGKVRGRWRDRGAGATKTVELEAAKKGPLTTLKEVYQSEAECRAAVEARVRELRAGEASVSITTIGDPTARAEAGIVVAGVSLDADVNWIAKRVTQMWQLDLGGATSEIECERGADAD